MDDQMLRALPLYPTIGSPLKLVVIERLAWMNLSLT